jgi:CO dehydrogenase nickel-insertion accessory protein CooC1
LGYVPQDEKVAYHDLVGKPITEISDSPGIQAVRRIVEDEIFPERFAASR